MSGAQEDPDEWPPGTPLWTRLRSLRYVAGGLAVLAAAAVLAHVLGWFG